MPAPAGLDAGTASQLIRGVRRTRRRECAEEGAAWLT
jgi:predicted RNA-binding Zn ribbon-like protein